MPRPVYARVVRLHLFRLRLPPPVDVLISPSVGTGAATPPLGGPDGIGVGNREASGSGALAQSGRTGTASWCCPPEGASGGRRVEPSESIVELIGREATVGHVLAEDLRDQVSIGVADAKVAGARL